MLSDEIVDAENGSGVVHDANQLDYPRTGTEDLHNSNNSARRDQSSEHGTVHDQQSDPNFADTEFVPEIEGFCHRASVSSRRNKKTFQTTEQLMEVMGAHRILSISLNSAR